MKKIFAIALALVMVLSMASAFASQCTGGFDWTKADVTNCGKATVEVVPYVKVPNGCGGFEWQVSECAAAVATEDVFFAVKLTVDANPDAEWVAKASVKVSDKGTTWAETSYSLTGVATDASKQEVYYLNGTTWKQVGTDSTDISVADDVEKAVANNGYIFAAEADGKTVKVCATLTSTGNNFVEGVVGEYYVWYPGEGASIYVFENAAAQAKQEAGTETTYLVCYSVENGKVKMIYNNTKSSCAPYDYDSIVGFFGLKVGDKVDQKLVNKNFGWDDKVEDCFTWGAAASIVDAECVVAIPKTGDASVLAWLF